MPIGVPAAVIASSLIGAGSGIAGSVISGGSHTSTGTSQPTFTPDEQTLLDKLMNYSGSTVSDPSAGLGPLKQAGEESINTSFGNLPSIISSLMARRGYGSSGSFGNTLYQTQAARLGAQSQLQGQYAGLVSQRQQNAASLGDQLLGTVAGKTTTSTTPDYSSSNGLLSGGNAFNNLGSFLMLQKLLGGGGSGSGSGYSETSTPSFGLPTGTPDYNSGEWGQP